MALGRFADVVAEEVRRPHFAAMLCMGPLAGVAISALQTVGLVAPSPFWLIPAILLVGQTFSTSADIAWKLSPTRVRLHCRLAAQALCVTATIYATGWGPGLAVGLLLVGQEALATTGPNAQRAVLGWNLSSLAVGQTLIALGWAPSLLPVPQVHGLAALMAIGITFSYRSLATALVEKEAAGALIESRERRFRSLVQSSQDLVFVVDADRIMTYASPSCLQVLGYEPGALLGPEAGRLVHPDDIEGLRHAVGQTTEADASSAEFCIRILRKDGTWCWIEGRATNLLGDDAVRGIVVNARDITDRARAEEAIRHQAMHDPLTQLPNRTLFNDRLEHALQRRARSGGFVAVLVVDLDGFKNVNDSLGHLTGDALLMAVADRFRSTLRDVDTIARLGGDEFAMLVDDLEAPDQAGRVAQRVLDALVDAIDLADRSVAIGASVGIALADRSDTSAEELFSNADAAMYRAKREGKRCYRVFEASMHAAAVERMDLEQALRAAIANDELTVNYQPVVDTETGHVVSFEALARWTDPQKGFIPPDVFIPLAEESGLIIEIGRTVLLEACRQTKTWHRAFPEVRPGVAVNVSMRQLADPSFVDDVASALAETGLDAESLTLEITESVLASDSGRVIAVLDELRRTGVRIAIDDFGTGYSSFAALAELPIDTLKIDKSFIDNLLRNREGHGFVNAILQLARTLHVVAVAEGVEDNEQREGLAALGCSHVQGYLFARPMAADAVVPYLEQREASLPSELAG